MSLPNILSIMGLVVLELAMPGVLSARLADRAYDQESLAASLHDQETRRTTFLDVDSEMSRLLKDAGVIKVDTYNKPGDTYRLRIESGNFERKPFLSGVFKFSGAYAGLLLGGSAGGLGGMMAGGAAGMAAGHRAADTLSRILQGQGSIEAVEEKSMDGLHVQTLEETDSSDFGKLLEPVSSVASQLASDSAPQDVFKISEQNLFSSVHELLSMGSRYDKAMLPAEEPQQPPKHMGFMEGMFAEAMAKSPYVRVEDVDRKVITGLGAALKSDNAETREDAKVTIALLDILRHSDEDIEVDVI